MVTRSTVRDGSLNKITRCHMLHAKTPVHRLCTTTTPASCTVRSISRAFQVPASSAMAQRCIGFSVAEILDPANFKRSYGSSEEDADRQPAAVAVAAVGNLMSTISAAV